VDLDDEPSLIDASRRGDSGAFASLVARYQRMIHALTYRMSGSEADAADLAQEAFVLAWRRLDSFREESRFSSWLYRIAVNLCLNWNVRTARENRARTEWSRMEATSGPSESDPRAAFVQEALLKLPPKQRAAIVLTVYDEMSHGAAARVLECSEATVSWRVFAARRKLKRLLEQRRRQEGGSS
jgi:RNA polymerase sigma-70 factor (ECF subfamily)